MSFDADAADNFDNSFLDSFMKQRREEAERRAMTDELDLEEKHPPSQVLPPPPPVEQEAGAAGPQAPEEEGPGFLGTIGDIGEQLIGGIRDAGVNTLQTVADLGGLVTSGINFDELIPDVDDAETGAGAFARGTAQFLTGFIPALGALRALKATRAVAALLNSARASGAVGVALTGEVAKFTAAGALADFAVFDPHGDRLSNLAIEFGFDNPVTQFLASDEDDTEFEGRLKSVLEGAGLGLIMDGVLQGIRFSAGWAKTQRAMVTDNLVTPKTRTQVHVSGADVTYTRQALADLKRVRARWEGLGRAGGDAVAADAREALRLGKNATTPEGRTLLESAEFKAGQSGRAVALELDALTKPLDQAAEAASPIGRIESENPDLAGSIRRTTSQTDELDLRIEEAQAQMDVAEEQWYEAVTTDDWRANYDDVRIPAEKQVDDYVPAEVADEVAEAREFLDLQHCR